jgi:hypothetical protein
MAVSQARLIEFAAAVDQAVRWEGPQARAEDALTALREHNWAAGLDLEGTILPGRLGSTARPARARSAAGAAAADRGRCPRLVARPARPAGVLLPTSLA